MHISFDFHYSLFDILQFKFLLFSVLLCVLCDSVVKLLPLSLLLPFLEP